MSRFEKAPRGSNNSLYLLLGILLLMIAVYFIDFGKWFGNEPSPIEIAEPQFKKEGVLTFIKSTGEMITTISIEIAETEAEQMQGFMYRKSIDDGTGMLFPYDREAPRSFWMRNTYVSLDIIYINANKEIVSIGKRTSPLSEDSVRSEGPSQYVLEVVGGFTDVYKIGKGDKIDFRKL